LDGGSGAGVSINPVAFLVINNDTIKLMPIDHISTVDKLVDYIPDILNQIGKLGKDKKEDSEKDKAYVKEEKVEEVIYNNVEPKTEYKENSQGYLEDE
jgi:uncharacterized spore protein YtfJ